MPLLYSPRSNREGVNERAIMTSFLSCAPMNVLVFRVVKSRKVRLMRHVACMVDMENAYLKDVQCHNTGTYSQIKGTINHLKTELIRNNVYKFGSYLTGNIPYYIFTTQTNKLMLFKKISTMCSEINMKAMHSLGRMHCFSMLKHIKAG
jgi:hypothetical protein